MLTTGLIRTDNDAMTTKAAKEDVNFIHDSISMARSQALIASWGLQESGKALEEQDESDNEDFKYETEMLVFPS